MRAWEKKKKKACRSLFMVMLITTVLSPRAASFPSTSASFHCVFVLHQGPGAPNGVGLLPPTAAAICSAHDKWPGPGHLQLLQLVPLERRLAESKMSRIK